MQIRGRIGSEISRQTADSLARARFGSGSVYTATQVDETLPQTWGVRALAGLEVLSILASGSVVVTVDEMRVTGKTGRQDARAAIMAILGEKLGEGATVKIDVTYDKQLDKSLGLPSPQECETQIVEIIGDRKLTFEPGSATLDTSAKDILDDVAVLLKKCGDVRLEIGGHTDSQGRESMNQQLSQDRAQSVLEALRVRLCSGCDPTASKAMAKQSPSPPTTPRTAARRTGGSPSSCWATRTRTGMPRWTRTRRRTRMPRRTVRGTVRTPAARKTPRRRKGQGMNRTEFVVATAIILFVAFCLGWFAYWLVHRFTRVSQADVSELERMSQELHEAEETRDQAITYLQQREAELTNQLAQTEAELRAAMDGLREARHEAEELRDYLERTQTG